MKWGILYCRLCYLWACLLRGPQSCGQNQLLASTSLPYDGYEAQSAWDRGEWRLGGVGGRNRLFRVQPSLRWSLRCGIWPCRAGVCAAIPTAAMDPSRSAWCPRCYGGFLLVWSDHDVWPIGSLSFVETFFGQDREIIEHKLYGILALVIACCETLRRIGRVQHPAWAAPLVVMALVGGLLLFVHAHGNHPATARIEFHHALLGSVGVWAALSKGLASWLPSASPRIVKRWEVAWAGSVILFGLLLLIYSE